MSQTIHFDAATHTYTLGGRVLASVGSVVKRYKLPFDAEFWSKRVAAREGVEVEAVRALWAKKAGDACDNGTALHEHVKTTLTGGNSRLRTPQAVAWNGWWGRASASLKVEACEVVLFSAELGIAGTADLVARSSKTGKLHVIDWKTNGKFTTSSDYGKTMLGPFTHLAECSLSEYSMQVELYRLLGQRQFGEAFGDGWVVHLGDTATPHRAHRLVELWEKVLEKVTPCS